MKTWQLVIFCILIGITLSGLIFFIASPPRGEPIHLEPYPTPQPIYVHAAGAVVEPGVYALPAGSRVRDAIDAAGGFADQADTDAVNLAAPLQDGAKLTVPEVGAVAPVSRAGPPILAEPALESDPAGLIDLNSATQAELESLPGIGATRALAILEHRRTHGPFIKKEDIQEVPGIGPGIFSQLKELITVSSAPGITE